MKGICLDILREIVGILGGTSSGKDRGYTRKNIFQEREAYTKGETPGDRRYNSGKSSGRDRGYTRVNIFQERGIY